MPKHIHIIGIAGVATSAIGIALRNASWKVTGSDKGFFPPASTALQDAGISFYAGWHPEKITADGIPDVVMIGGSGKSSENPETIFAKEKKIPIYSFPEIIEKYFLRKNSLVCAGTWGKTTTSSLLSYIFEQAEKNPSYMFGGLSLSQKQSAKIADGEWSIIEGDEYTGSQFDNTAKFFHYHPTHLLLTSVFWDHADVYPTPSSYFQTFEKLLSELKKNELIVSSNDDLGVKTVLQNTRKKSITYGKSSDSLYRYENVSQTKDGISFDIIGRDLKKHRINSSMLGSFQADNITGCFAMAKECGIPEESIIQSIHTFKGMMRRMEKRYDKEVTIIDDIAHSPEKAKSILETLKEIYKGKIYAIFEPNIGGRERLGLSKYDNSFLNADEVIIPRLSSLKLKNNGEKPMDGDEITQVISKTHTNANYIQDDRTLIDHLKNISKQGDCIVFLGSHSFRGMIPELIKILSSN